MKNAVNGGSLVNWRGIFSENTDLTLSKYAGERVVQAHVGNGNPARIKEENIFKLGKCWIVLFGVSSVLSGCALAPLVIEKLVTVGVGVWGVQQHQERQKEIKAVQERVDQMGEAKAVEFPLP